MNRSQNTKYSDKQRDGLADHLLGTQNSDDDCVSMSEAPHSSLGPGQGRPRVWFDCPGHRGQPEWYILNSPMVVPWISTSEYCRMWTRCRCCARGPARTRRSRGAGWPPAAPPPPRRPSAPQVKQSQIILVPEAVLCSNKMFSINSWFLRFIWV